ncbi:hypothetical protein [Spirillospora sp. NPDC047279]|uniref:hypothetical protein n=1 Tax=Spirillospora sp. NPDC047279 TaxID=3155478 RepID=UPI0033E14B1C
MRSKESTFHGALQLRDRLLPALVLPAARVAVMGLLAAAAWFLVALLSASTSHAATGDADSCAEAGVSKTTVKSLAGCTAGTEARQRVLRDAAQLFAGHSRANDRRPAAKALDAAARTRLELLPVRSENGRGRTRGPSVTEAAESTAVGRTLLATARGVHRSTGSALDDLRTRASRTVPLPVTTPIGRVIALPEKPAESLAQIPQGLLDATAAPAGFASQLPAALSGVSGVTAPDAAQAEDDRPGHGSSAQAGQPQAPASAAPSGHRHVAAPEAVVGGGSIAVSGEPGPAPLSISGGHYPGAVSPSSAGHGAAMAGLPLSLLVEPARTGDVSPVSDTDAVAASVQDVPVPAPE